MKKIISLLAFFLITVVAVAQASNSTLSEVVSYKEKDGLIVVGLIVNGKSADFLIDLNGENTILSEYVEKLNIEERIPLPATYFRQGEAIGSTEQAVVSTLSLGNNVSSNMMKFFVAPDSDNHLRSLEVAGTINNLLFKNCVLTINAQRHELTTSIPFRPSYMSLKNRVNITNVPKSLAVAFPLQIDGKLVDCTFDTSEKAVLAFADKAKVSHLQFVNVDIPQPEVGILSKDGNPIVGLGLLQYGIISIDYLRAKGYFQTYEETTITEEAKPELVVIENGKLNEIGRTEFLEYIFDYRNSTDLVLKGDKPVVIDFWANWCAPCMKLLPEMKKLAEKYKDQVIFYKVNADEEKELCSRFNVSSLPTLLFVPKEGQPIREIGNQPDKIVELIEKQLLGN